MTHSSLTAVQLLSVTNGKYIYMLFNIYKQKIVCPYTKET